MKVNNDIILKFDPFANLEEYAQLTEKTKRTSIWLYLRYIEIIIKRIADGCEKELRDYYAGNNDRTKRRELRFDTLVLDVKSYYIFAYTVITLAISLMEKEAVKKFWAEPVIEHITYIRNKALQHLYNDKQPDIAGAIGYRKGSAVFHTLRKIPYRRKPVSQIDAAFRKVLKKHKVFDLMRNPREHIHKRKI